MPAYIEMCLETWKLPFTVLNYANLGNYTDFDVEGAKWFTLPQIADCVRVHVLRDQGGIWLDADTIMMTKALPGTNMIGNPKERETSIGYLRTEAGSDMFKAWAQYQDDIIARRPAQHWALMGNLFVDRYVREHPEITICSIRASWPETIMITGDIPRHEKYRQFYFEKSFHLGDIPRTDMLMLHNSWTPDWYKYQTREAIAELGCTMSNVLREAL